MCAREDCQGGSFVRTLLWSLILLPMSSLHYTLKILLHRYYIWVDWQFIFIYNCFQWCHTFSTSQSLLMKHSVCEHPTATAFPLLLCSFLPLPFHHQYRCLYIFANLFDGVLKTDLNTEEFILLLYMCQMLYEAINQLRRTWTIYKRPSSFLHEP